MLRPVDWRPRAHANQVVRRSKRVVERSTPFPIFEAASRIPITYWQSDSLKSAAVMSGRLLKIAPNCAPALPQASVALEHGDNRQFEQNGGMIGKVLHRALQSFNNRFVLISRVAP